MNAISLNRDATHVWSNISASMICDLKTEEMERLKHRNVDDFRDLYDIISYEQLPQPEKETCKF